MTVSIDRSAAIPMSAGLGGFNQSWSDGPESLGDPAVRAMVKPLKPAILRWPGGTVDDFFDWKTGLIPPPVGAGNGSPGPIDIEQSQFAPFPSLPFNNAIAQTIAQRQPILSGKGGNPLGTATSGFAGFARAVGSAKLLVVVNGLTDTAASAEQLAYTIAKERLPIVGFELCNEPFFVTVPTSTGAIHRSTGPNAVPIAFSDGVDYLTQTKPYRDAIKQGFTRAGVDPARAVVAIAGGFAADSSALNAQWAKDLTSYTSAHGTYWDAVAMHFYPPSATRGGFDQAMTFANDALGIGTDGFIATYRATNWSRGKPLLISEYGVTLSDEAMNGSVYAGVISAEYMSRLSLYPETTGVLFHELFDDQGGISVPASAIDGTGDWRAKLAAAGRIGRTIDTSGHLSGMYDSAQILGVGLANAAINGSDASFGTKVSGAFGAVPTRSGNLPAIFAQAYRDRRGSVHVLATNKGSDAKLIQIVVDGVTVRAAISVDSVNPTGGDPAQQNSSSAHTVTVTHASVTGPVRLPGYSVAHLHLVAP